MNAPSLRPTLPLALPLLPLLPLSLLLLTACSSAPPVPSPIENETVCTDYEIAATHARMHGSMRKPVVLTVLAGKNVLAQKILSGLTSPKAEKSMLPLPDADAEYQVDWAQCNTRLGPYPIEQPVPILECDAPVYKTDKLITKKGDAASRSIKFVLPPEASCWLDENAPLPGSAPTGTPTAAPAK